MKDSKNTPITPITPPKPFATPSMGNSIAVSKANSSIVVKGSRLDELDGFESKTKLEAGISFKSLRRDSPSLSSDDIESDLNGMFSQIYALEQERKMEEELRNVALDRIKAEQEPKDLKAGELRIKGVEKILSDAQLKMKTLNYKEALELKKKQEESEGFHVKSSLEFFEPEPNDSGAPIATQSVARRLFDMRLEQILLQGYDPNESLLNRLGDIKDVKSLEERKKYEEMHPKKFSPDYSSGFQASRSLEEFSKVIGVLSPQQDQSSSNRIGRYVLEATENNSIKVRREETTDDSLQKLKNAIRVFEKEIEKNKLEKLKLLKEIKKLNEEKKEVRSKIREIKSKVNLGEEKESDYPSPDPAPIAPPRKLSSNKTRKGRGSSL